MCGIALVAGAQGPADFPDLLTLLQRRGPDSQSSVQIPLAQTEMTVMASLLQLRGSTPSSCPLTHVSGAVLAFNGEVFGGLQVPVGTSDAATLLQALCGIPGLLLSNSWGSHQRTMHIRAARPVHLTHV
ncbi:hypothetical protein V8C86DRAFT_9902 [Haematococcus lacustris]